MPALESKPGLWPWLEHIWRAFHILSASRRHVGGGMVVMPEAIDFQNICLYAEKYMIYNEEDFDEFLDHILFLDQLYRKHANEKARAEMDKQKQENENPRAAPMRRRK